MSPSSSFLACLSRQNNGTGTSPKPLKPHDRLHQLSEKTKSGNRLLHFPGRLYFVWFSFQYGSQIYNCESTSGCRSCPSNITTFSFLFSVSYCSFITENTVRKLQREKIQHGDDEPGLQSAGLGLRPGSAPRLGDLGTLTRTAGPHSPHL